MTCLAAWLAKDSNGASSAYLMSDSRITWGLPPVHSWPFGPKIFASSKHPVVIGYCGDSIFGASSLIQAMTLIDAGNLAGPLSESVLQIGQVLAQSFRNYPAESLNRQAQFILCYRLAPLKFSFYELGFSAHTDPIAREVLPNPSSGLVGVWGSGKAAFEKEHRNWQDSDVGGLSLAIPGAFLDMIRAGGDPRTGDGPQIVGLYRKGPGIHHGIFFDGKRFVAGLEIDDEDLERIPIPVEWRNENFERCDPRSGKILSGAKRQPRPHL
jgi:hypothetical protein